MVFAILFLLLSLLSMSMSTIPFTSTSISIGPSRVVLAVKTPTCQRRKRERLGFDPWVGKIPWRRAWQPTPVFLPGKSPGQRSLAGYSLWGHRNVRKNLRSKQQCKIYFVIVHWSFSKISSVVQSCLTLWDTMDCSTQGILSISNS